MRMLPGQGRAIKVRILMLDHELWKADWLQAPLLTAPFQHVSIFEFMAIENERVIPQQSASIITSVDDIEGYIKAKGVRYEAVALSGPSTYRNPTEKEATRELAYMGITAGSLSPGLDGGCEELSQRNFDT